MDTGGAPAAASDLREPLKCAEHSFRAPRDQTRTHSLAAGWTNRKFQCRNLCRRLELGSGPLEPAVPLKNGGEQSKFPSAPRRLPKEQSIPPAMGDQPYRATPLD